MDNPLHFLLLSADQLIRLAAFLVVFYFSGTLYRRRAAGSSALLFGCAAVLIGEGTKAAAFTGVLPAFLWMPGLLLTSAGFVLGAYGFAAHVRASVGRP